MTLKNNVDNLLKIPSIYYFIYKCYKRQKQFMKKTILLNLEEFKKHNDNSLTESDFYKIKFYYGLAVPIIAEIYCILRGKTITHNERISLTYLGAITGLFDDFFDERGTPVSHINELVNKPNIEICRNYHERLFVQFYLKALEQDNATLIKECFNVVIEAQIQSKKQTDTKITTNEILNITQEKGGASILFYRAGLKNNFLDIEKELLFNIGFLGQLENDIFDLYKDYKTGIHTPATTAKSITSLRSQYLAILNMVYQQVEQTNFSKSNKKKFARFFAVIGTRGLVCLDHLMKLEINGSFEISIYSRTQLICDMGKLKNSIKWVIYYLGWNNDTKQSITKNTDKKCDH